MAVKKKKAVNKKVPRGTKSKPKKKAAKRPKKLKASALKIKRVETSELTPYAKNSRTHSDVQVAQIAASINEFGFTNPILIDEDHGVIAGHGRLLAAHQLEIKKVPCIILDGLSDIQKKAYVIADNKLALNAGWDEEMLSLELKDLQDMDFDLGLTGFDDDELGDFLNMGDEKTGLTDDDAVPEPPETPSTRLGDIWILGDHRLMCGDSTSVDAVDQLMDEQKADMVFTDPPYGIEYQSNMRTKTPKFDVLKNDDIELDIAPIIEMFSNGWVFVWTTWKVVDKWLKKLEVFGYPSNMIVWFKGGGGIGDLKKTFSTDYEMALVFNRGAELCGKRIGSVWSLNKDNATDYKHPTQKPVALPEEAIDKTTKSGNTVLDLFGGSGSTMIACEKSGRCARLMELDPKYCDVIIRRWQDYTGDNAILESTGKTYNDTKALGVD